MNRWYTDSGLRPRACSRRRSLSSGRIARITIAPPSRRVSSVRYEAGLKSEGDGVGLTVWSNILAGWPFSPFGSLESTRETQGVQSDSCIWAPTMVVPPKLRRSDEEQAAFHRLIS